MTSACKAEPQRGSGQRSRGGGWWPADRYRLIIFEDGASYGESSANTQSSGKARRGFSEKDLNREVDRSGELGIAEIARCKSRYFVDGAVLGSREWVNKVIEGLKGGGDLSPDRSKPSGRLKKSGLWSLRRLSDG